MVTIPYTCPVATAGIIAIGVFARLLATTSVAGFFAVGRHPGYVGLGVVSHVCPGFTASIIAIGVFAGISA